MRIKDKIGRIFALLDECNFIYVGAFLRRWPVVHYLMYNMFFQYYHKKLVNHFYFDFPEFTMWLQHVFAFTVLEIVRFFDYAPIRNYSISQGKHAVLSSIFLLSYLWISNVKVFSNQYPNYEMVKRLEPYFWLLIQICIIRIRVKQIWISRTQRVAFHVCVLGTVAACMYPSQYNRFDYASWVDGLMACLYQLGFLYTARNVVRRHHDITELQLLYLITVNACFWHFLRDCRSNASVGAVNYLLYSYVPRKMPGFFTTFLAVVVTPLRMQQLLLRTLAADQMHFLMLFGGVKAMLSPIVGDYWNMYFLLDPALAVHNYVGMAVATMAVMFYIRFSRLN